MFITVIYLAFSLCLSSSRDFINISELRNILINTLTNDILYMLYVKNHTFTPNALAFSFIGFLLILDVYYYIIHYLLHYYAFERIHKQHHRVFKPLYTWHSHYFEHWILNIGCFAVAQAIIKLDYIQFHIMLILYLLHSIISHTHQNPDGYYAHFINHKKRLGFIYIMDFILMN